MADDTWKQVKRICSLTASQLIAMAGRRSVSVIRRLAEEGEENTRIPATRVAGKPVDSKAAYGGKAEGEGQAG